MEMGGYNSRSSWKTVNTITMALLSSPEDNGVFRISELGGLLFKESSIFRKSLKS